MKPRRKATRKRDALAYLPATPAETCWLESDRYDRRAWAEIVNGAPIVEELIDAGQQLLPHFASLVQDLFMALFKQNLIWLDPDGVRRSAGLNRLIIEQLASSPPFEILKKSTLLEEDKAAIATVVMSEEVLELVRGERLINRSEMLDLFDLKHQEDDLEVRAKALEAANHLAKSEEAALQEDRTMDEKIEKLKEAARHAAQTSEARLNQKSRRLGESLEHLDRRGFKRIDRKTAELAHEIDHVAQDIHDFSAEFGQAANLPAGERLELGRRLARNKKIAQLARMLGRFRQDAHALRRKTVARGAAELYEIGRGAEPGRLIPAELVALCHPMLNRDFKRRLLEGALLQYELSQDDQKGKGPMIVCIDVSSSMQGDKELWAKAVALTLMDIARRQKRLFRAVLFASGDENLKVLDLNRERRYQPELARVLELAEYFPGGGTDFEKPLDAAGNLLNTKKLRRGDIVIITDGECQVGPEWLAQFKQRKKDLDFSVYAVVIVAGSSQVETLAQFSDRITTIGNLTSEGAREIFLAV